MHRCMTTGPTERGSPDGLGLRCFWNSAANTLGLSQGTKHVRETLLKPAESIRLAQRVELQRMIAL
ncbi:hypothetical protein SAMN02745166_04997 [Prosthecobacter debontii]|uniref:Uncharacterized protein n=1 Tax=Prosthecobacter debontii TaxID=48467 RepID=A0A1T4Z3S4_9BACT|nr:hypothetical protein SAMN02745166_04997 [Prosthecobacter debontii]